MKFRLFSKVYCDSEDRFLKFVLYLKSLTHRALVTIENTRFLLVNRRYAKSSLTHRNNDEDDAASFHMWNVIAIF